jgi:Methyltransferase domain
MNIVAQNETGMGIMPIDRVAWAGEVHVSMFCNAHAQLRDVRMFFPDARSILIIGPGQGLESAVFRWKGYATTTLDVDDTFAPDVLASCHDLSMFPNAAFDVVIASHVLEHLPIAYLDTAIAEIARVGSGALIYLPMAGRHSAVRIIPGIRGYDWSFIMDFANRFRKPSHTEALFCGGQHYWEIGYKGFRLKNVRNRISRSFRIITNYRNRDWIESYNFVLVPALI